MGESRPVVVVLDDDNEQLRIVEAKLRSNFEVVKFVLGTRENPALVDEIAKLVPAPEAILLDVFKDEWLGLKREDTYIGLLNRLKGRFGNRIPIFAMTSKKGDTDVEQVLNWYRSGIDDWIWKDALNIHSIADNLGDAIKCAESRRASLRGTLKVFVSHGGQTDEDSLALAKLVRFLEGCGATAVVVESTAGGLVSPNTQATQQMNECACAVILATRDRSGKDQSRTRQNVIYEFGMAQQHFDNRVIVLLEEGCQLPPMVSGFIYERFTPQCMEEAFTKVISELRGFKLL